MTTQRDEQDRPRLIITTFENDTVEVEDFEGFRYWGAPSELTAHERIIWADACAKHRAASKALREAQETMEHFLYLDETFLETQR